MRRAIPQIQHEGEEQQYHVKERRYGRVQRSIRLPKIADHDSVRAQYENGILRVCIDKKKASGRVGVRVRRSCVSLHCIDPTPC